MKYVKCSVLDKDRERVFSRIATRGVVKFFNVLNQQQTDIQNKIKDVGPYERKIDKVYDSIDKRSFLDRLKETNKDESNDDSNDSSLNTGSKPTWNVLRDDFIKGGEIDDWDKNDEDSENDGNDEKINKSKKVNDNNKKHKKKFKK